MPLDFRYHLVSLVAVFCALLIGILLGVALVGDPALEKQVDTYDSYLAAQQAQIEQLETQNRAHRTFGREVLPLLIQRKLTRRQLAIIVCRPLRPSLVEELPPLLASAGAQVVSTTTILPEFGRLTANEAAPLLEGMGYPMPVDRNVQSFLAAKLALQIAAGRPELPQRMRGLRLIEVAGDYTLPASEVLLVTGLRSNDSAPVEQVELPIIRALQDASVPVVACESSDVPHSALPYLQPRGLATVDNADMAPGRLALVLALAGRAGNYGIRPSADHLLPPREEW